MEARDLYRPRVSRETRLLLTAGLLAIAVLWLLARFRFQDQAVASNPIPAVLTQLAKSPRFDDLASEIARAQRRVEAALTLIGSPAIRSGGPAALSVSDGQGLAFLPNGSSGDPSVLLAQDPASGLALVRTPVQSRALPAGWTPDQLDQPRYVIAAAAGPSGIALRPAFVGALRPTATELWAGSIWPLPSSSDLAPGTFLFTMGEAELVGLVIARGSQRAIVPAATLFAEAVRLRDAPRTPAGTLGMETQPLTPGLTSVTGASGGVIVTWVDRDGPAAGRIRVGDVLETINGMTPASPEAWEVRLRRVSADDAVNLLVRRRGQQVDVTVVAAPVAASDSSSLGLTLRVRAGVGSEVLRVEPGSAASRAGVLAGDVVTLVGTVAAPTPAQIGRAFGALAAGQSVLLAVTRGTTHFLTTLTP